MKRLFSLLSFIICAGFLLSSCKVTPPATPTPEPTNPPVATPTFSVGGIVLDDLGSPVPNASISLIFSKTQKNYNTSSDSSGSFSFKGIKNQLGSFLIKASAQKQGLELIGSATGGVSTQSPKANLAVTLYRQGKGSISGKVLTKKESKLVKNALVTVTFAETDYSATTKTNSEGVYSLTALPTDGTLSIIVFDELTGGSASSISFLTKDKDSQEIDIVLDIPSNVHKEPKNISFNTGTLEGWDTEGKVQAVPLQSVFPPSSASGAANMGTQSITSAYVAVADTSQGAYGSLSQSFRVPKGIDSIVGVAKFLSDEYPKYYGSKYNDGYVITVSTPLGSQVLAKGNLNSSKWTKTGLLGYNGETPTISLLIDTSGFAATGGIVTITAEVSDVGDEKVDSALAIAFDTSDVSAIDQVEFVVPSQVYVLPYPKEKFTGSQGYERVYFPKKDALFILVPSEETSTIDGQLLTVTVPVVARVKNVLKSSNFQLPPEYDGFQIGCGPTSVALGNTSISFGEKSGSQPITISDGTAFVPVQLPAFGEGKALPPELAKQYYDYVSSLNVTLYGQGSTTVNSSTCQFAGTEPRLYRIPEESSTWELMLENVRAGNRAVTEFVIENGDAVYFGFSLIPCVGDAGVYAKEFYDAFLNRKDFDAFEMSLAGAGAVADCAGIVATFSSGVGAAVGVPAIAFGTFTSYLNAIYRLAKKEAPRLVKWLTTAWEASYNAYRSGKITFEQFIARINETFSDVVLPTIKGGAKLATRLDAPAGKLIAAGWDEGDAFRELSKIQTHAQRAGLDIDDASFVGKFFDDTALAEIIADRKCQNGKCIINYSWAQGHTNTLYSPNSFRQNLKRYTGLYNIPSTYEAHHVFPKAKEFATQFSSAGIDVHDPHHLVFWIREKHNADAHIYTSAWRKFFADNPKPTKDEVLNFGRNLMKKRGLDVNY